MTSAQQGHESTGTTTTTARRHTAKPIEVSVGVAQPLGATCTPTGVNFSIYSEHATTVTLLLFDSDRAKTPDHEIVLNARDNKSFHFWHCHVAGVGPGQVYAYRMDGPFDPTGTGLRFNRDKVLIDPYALGNTKTLWDRNSAVGSQDNLGTSLRSVVIEPTTYDWEGDRPLNTPLSETVIYEAHVRGFTKSPSSRVKHPGTFRGIIEKISYLKSLGHPPGPGVARLPPHVRRIWPGIPRAASAPCWCRFRDATASSWVGGGIAADDSRCPRPADERTA